MKREASNLHLSSCAVHNAPAYEPGLCDCGLEFADEPTTELDSGRTVGNVDTPDHWQKRALGAERELCRIKESLMP